MVGQTPERSRSDLEFMCAPKDWPRWPALPVKRWVRAEHGASQMETGMLVNIAKDVVPPVVRLGNVYDARSFGKERIYDSLEALVADGWVVD